MTFDPLTLQVSLFSSGSPGPRAPPAVKSVRNDRAQQQTGKHGGSNWEWWCKQQGGDAVTQAAAMRQFFGNRKSLPAARAFHNKSMRAAENLLGRNLLDFWFGVVLIFLFILGFTSSCRTLVLDPVRTRGFVTFLQAKDEITFILEGPALLASLTWNRAGPNPTEPNGAGPGFGTNSQAVRYLDQDYEVLKRRLFQDDSFPALGSLGFNELGPR